MTSSTPRATAGPAVGRATATTTRKRPRLLHIAIVAMAVAAPGWLLTRADARVPTELELTGSPQAYVLPAGICCQPPTSEAALVSKMQDRAPDVAQVYTGPAYPPLVDPSLTDEAINAVAAGYTVTLGDQQAGGTVGGQPGSQQNPWGPGPQPTTDYSTGKITS